MGNVAATAAPAAALEADNSVDHARPATDDAAGAPGSKFQGAVSRLISTRIPRDANHEWRRLWEWPKCSDDVWAKFSFTLIRTLRVKNPYNLSALIIQLVEKIEEFMLEDDPAALPKEDPEIEARYVLNCVRLLTRCLPVALETREDPFYQEFLWQGVFPENPAKDEEVDSNEKETFPQERISPPSPAVRIVQALMKLLFVPGFTTPADGNSRGFVSQDLYEVDGANPDLAWPGVYSESDAGILDRNRTEVLKCLLACCSLGLFVPSTSYRHDDNAWIQCMASLTNEYAPTLLVSLLEIAASYHSGYMPYSHTFFEDYREPLLQVSLQVLIVLLDFRTLPRYHQSEKQGLDPPSQSRSDSVDTANEEKIEEEEQVDNAFLEHIKRIRLAPSLSVLYEGLTRLLNNSLDVSSTYLPNSVKQISCYQEVLVLFWKLLESNEEFFCFAATRADNKRLIMPLLFLTCTSRLEPGKVGMVHTCALILLKLSSERDFAVAFNQACDKMPVDISIAPGCIADVLIVIIHELLVDSSTFVESLYHVLLTILCNISPYIRSLNWESSSKLLHLFEIFSSTRFLYSGRNHHQYVNFFLEIFNNVIQYQYNGNCRLIYGMTRKSKRFFELGHIPVPQNSPLVSSDMKTGAVSNPTLTREVSAKLAPIRADASGDALAVKTPSQSNSEASPANKDQNEADPKLAEDETEKSVKAEATVQDEQEQEQEEEHEEKTQVLEEPKEEESSDEQLSKSKRKVMEPDQNPSREASTPASVAPVSGRFVPSVDWIVSWKRKLPLGPIYRMLEFFLPRMNALTESGDINSERKVLEFFQNATLVGVLPLPHSIIVRRYRQSGYTAIWFSSFIWGIVFLRHQRQLLFDPSSVKLFAISQSRA